MLVTNIYTCARGTLTTIVEITDAEAPTVAEDPTTSNLPLLTIYISSGAALVVLVVIIIVIVVCIAALTRSGRSELISSALKLGSIHRVFVHVVLQMYRSSRKMIMCMMSFLEAYRKLLSHPIQPMTKPHLLKARLLCVLQLHAACRHFILLLNFLPYRDETIISLHPGHSSKKTGSTQHLGPLHNILCIDMYNNDQYTFAADFDFMESSTLLHVDQ